jgi:Mn-dependent DtxR family transcriptional regulator/predicted Zn-ribbon and HTH transcriptional regulator
MNMNTNYQTLSPSIQDVVDMLDKQIVNKQQLVKTKKANIETAMKALELVENDLATLQTVREQTVQMLSPVDEKTSLEKVTERVSSRKKQAMLSELNSLIAEEERQSGGRFAGENIGLAVPADNEYISFTDRQENWQRVYWAMKRGRTSMIGMSKELGWNKQKVRDCLRGLRDLGLVYKEKQDTYRLVENPAPTKTTDTSGKHVFTSRQWRWELVYKLIVAGYTKSSSISKKLSVHGMNLQRVSEILGKLSGLGLVTKKTKNKWVATGKGVVFCDYHR